MRGDGWGERLRAVPEGGGGELDGCPPNSDGRAVDAGCFMRYSDKPFFPANATVDLAAYMRSGEFTFAIAIERVREVKSQYSACCHTGPRRLGPHASEKVSK